MALQLVEDTEDISGHKKGGVPRSAIRDARSQRSGTAGRTDGTRTQQRVDIATLDKDTHLGRLSGSYQVVIAHNPWPRAVASEMYLQ